MLSYWEKNSIDKLDTAIIGGGITGLSTAISLAQRNPLRKIAVLEAGSQPSGASTKNAGFACFGSLTEILYDIDTHGLDETRDLLSKRYVGLEILKNRIPHQKMDYHEWGGFEILSPQNHRAVKRLEEVNQALDPLFGQRVFSEEPDLVSKFGLNPVEATTVIKNPLEGQLNPHKMIQYLTALALELGVTIVDQAKVESIGDESPFTLSLPKHPISEIIAEKVVVCTNAFSKTLLPDISLNPGRGQVLITSPIDSLKLKGTFHSDEGYIYFRNVGKRLLIGGARNADFEGETTTEFGTSKVVQDQLIHWIENVILPNTPYEVEHRWSGIMAFGPERKPILSNPRPGLHLGIRLGGMGVALGSWIGAELAKAHDAE